MPHELGDIEARSNAVRRWQEGGDVAVGRRGGAEVRVQSRDLWLVSVYDRDRDSESCN